LNKQKFLAFYVKDNQALAASSKRDTVTAARITWSEATEELLRLKRMPAFDKLRQGQFKLKESALLSS